MCITQIDVDATYFDEVLTSIDITSDIAVADGLWIRLR